MVVVWIFQASIGYTYIGLGKIFMVQFSAIFLQPVSTLLFSIMYSETVRKILKFKKYQTRIQIMKMIAYLDILVIIFFFGCDSHQVNWKFTATY